MTTLSDMSLSRKFLLLALLALALIGAPTVLYVQKSVEVTRQAVQEARGIEPIDGLLKAVQLAQQHRGLSSSVLDAGQAVGEARKAKAIEVNRAIETVERLLQAREAPAQLVAAWQQSMNQWRSLEAKVGQGALSGVQSFALHTELISAWLQIEDLLLDHFEISLDPVFETYYLHIGALVYLPETAELLAQLRARGALMLAQRTIEPADRAGLAAQASQARARFARMVLAFDKVGSAKPAFKAGLEAPLAQLRLQVLQVGAH